MRSNPEIAVFLAIALRVLLGRVRIGDFHLGSVGAQTKAASMNKIIEQSGSNTPMISFTVCYAISNVLLAVCGLIIIAATAGCVAQPGVPPSNGCKRSSATS